MEIILSSAFSGGVMGSLIALACIPLSQIAADLRNKRQNTMVSAGITLYILNVFGIVVFASLSFIAFTLDHSQFIYPVKLAFGSVFSFFALFTLGRTLDAAFRKIVWNDQGMMLQQIGRKTRFIPWDHLDDLHWDKTKQEWRLKFRDNSEFTLQPLMNGTEHFFESIIYIYRPKQFADFQKSADL
jgi:hypothetical protein